jgi:DNA-binding transcriptional LysR family regulator
LKQATLHQLKVFEAAARHSSFTRAAEELFLTQPTVSMQIKQLTKTVGLSLFEQVGRKIYLTDAGRELYTTCKQLFDQLSQFEMTVADLKGLKRGNLRLAVVTTAKYVVPRMLGPFCQAYPGIDVALTVTTFSVNRLIIRILCASLFWKIH